MAERTGPDFEVLFRTAGAGLVVTADDDTIVEVNDWFPRWTGMAREELVGLPFMRLLSVADRILLSTRTALLLELSGHVAEIAVTIVTGDGERLPATLGASRITTDPPFTLFVVSPRREQSFEEAQLLSALRLADDAETRRRSAEQDLEQVSRRDALTGLLNRSGAVDAVADRLVGSRQDGVVSAAWIGLDHFRVVTESLGRAAGDDVLSTIAGRLERRFGDEATVGRVGGDEFVVVLPERSSARLADEVLALVAEPLTADDVEIVVSASIGLADHEPSGTDVDHEPAVGAEDLLQRAGLGMYAAKAAGRNRWRRAAPASDESALDEIRLLGEIRTAIAESQLFLEYQPQLDVRTGELHGLEALVRWQHPSRGLVPPSGFIDVAEKSGLISQIGVWVCATAVEHAARLARGPSGSVQMSLNISARQFGEAGFAESVIALLHAADLDPGLLTLELTETGLATDLSQITENFRMLQEHGVRLSIDDFGTGHASFAYLRDLAVDEIKIDQSYVGRIESSAEASAIVVSCVELAHALSVSVVAEGVERQSQLTRLADIGCDVVQGYLFSRPLGAEALQAWMAARRTA
ncbi:MAG: EAL domain-containing protein [Aeromicrobium sp.]